MNVVSEFNVVDVFPKVVCLVSDVDGDAVVD